jgi:hypothetical protein
MRNNKKVENIDFKTFVDIFNTQGKKAAVRHVTETYGVRYDTIVKRLRQESEFIFDQSRDRYMLKHGITTESPFLTVEELCQEKTLPLNIVDSEDIIVKLIKDKFFEMSKYVTLENSTMKIIINLGTARKYGYEVEYV